MVEVPNSPPRASLIIPVRNAERTIGKTLEYLEALDYPADRLQVIIADGGSTDGTIAIVEDYRRSHANVTVVAVPNCASPGHARNEALKVATGEFVLFTDGDCAPEPDWVQRMLAPFLADAAVGGVGGEILTLRTEGENDTESYCEQVGFLSVSGRCGLTQSGYLPPLRQRAPHEVNGGNYSPFFATANAAFRREAILAAGGEFWPEPTGEDVDFCLRVQGAGYRLYFAKEAVVKHMHRVSLASYLKQWYGYGYGHPLLVSKHAEGGLEIVIQTPEPLFLRLPGPANGIVHVGAFHLAHLGAAGAVLGGAATLVVPALAPVALAGLGLAVISGAAYFSPCLKLQPRGKLLTWCKLRYLTNWAFIRGALDGWRHFGTICVEPSW